MNPNYNNYHLINLHKNHKLNVNLNLKMNIMIFKTVNMMMRVKTIFPRQRNHKTVNFNLIHNNWPNMRKTSINFIQKWNKSVKNNNRSLNQERKNWEKRTIKKKNPIFIKIWLKQKSKIRRFKLKKKLQFLMMKMLR